MASWAVTALRDDLIRVSGHSAATGWKTAAALRGELGEVVRAVHPYYGDELDPGAISSTRLYERSCTDLELEGNQVSFPCIVKKNNTLLEFGTLQGNVIFESRIENETMNL